MAKLGKVADTEVKDEVAAAAPVIAKTFADVMEGKPQPSLRAIADVLDTPQQRIYGVAKQPIAGQVFDPRVYNWMAISKFIEKRIGKADDLFATFEEVYEAAIKRDDELGASDKRRGSRGEGSSKVMIDVGDGKQIPARRKEIAVGDIVHLKNQEGDLKVVYLTDTHVVMQVGDSTLLTCLSNWTFNQKYFEPKVAKTDTVNA